MAEDRIASAREDGGPVVAEYGWGAMADGIDPAVYRAQAPVCDPARDAVSIDPGREQLLTAHATVLTMRQLGKPVG